MAEKKYQIFISSTYTDLIEARRTVIDTVLGLYHFPVGMEMFGSDDDDQWDFIKDTIKESDYYLLIIGHRYGSLSEDGISYTEKEFDYAKSLGIPIISFIRDRGIATLPSERDTDPSLALKIEEFIKKAQNGKLVSYWDTIDKLSAEVAKSLPKTMARHQRIGWIKADKAVSSEMMNELTNLSIENRELRQELDTLKKNSNNQPDIDVCINQSSSLELLLKATNSDIIKVIHINEIEDILKPYVNNDEIISYNSFINSNREIVDEYNKELEERNHINCNKNDVSITLINQGKSIANKIYVDIQFPTEILVMHGEKFIEMPKPIEFLPRHPQSSAIMRYVKDSNDDPGLKDYFNHRLINRVLEDYNDSFIDTNYISSLHENEIALIENKITIYKGSLMHTRDVVFKNDYVIVPLNKGTFDITITSICSEHPEPKVTIFPIIIS